jgi:hypothetical protein
LPSVPTEEIKLMLAPTLTVRLVPAPLATETLSAISHVQIFDQKLSSLVLFEPVPSE